MTDHTTNDPTNEIKLCECGCGNPAPIAKRNNKGRGYVKGQPIRFINGHNGIEPKKRFWKKVDKRGPNDCWEWQASTYSSGYGRIAIGGRGGGMALAHRFSWELHNGAIADGLYVLHICDHTKCCNPAHLFLGTHDDNMTDMVNKGRQAKGVGHGVAKLTPEKVRHIRTLAKMGAMRQSIANRFGVGKTTIGEIIAGKRWKHVE